MTTFNLVPQAITTKTPKKIGKRFVDTSIDLKFDFEKGDFVVVGGSPSTVIGDDSLIQWIKKTLSTPRYNYLIYSWQYGNEVYDMIGKSFFKQMAHSLIDQFIREALSTDKRIADITKISSIIDHENIFVDITIKTSNNQEVSVQTSLLI